MPAILATLWNLRSLAPWAIAGLAVVVALFYRGEAAGCRAQAAAEAAKAEAMVRAAKEADQAATRLLEEKTATITAAIREQAQATQVALARVASDPRCARTPAAAAFDSAVRK